MASWVQDPVTGKLIPKVEYHAHYQDSILIQGDIEPFVSPIDQSVISSRSTLRAHMKKHGVTDSRDYSQDYYKAKAQARASLIAGNTSAQKRARIDSILKSLSDLGV